jgi:hypothetical protein
MLQTVNKPANKTTSGPASRRFIRIFNTIPFSVVKTFLPGISSSIDPSQRPLEPRALPIQFTLYYPGNISSFYTSNEEKPAFLWTVQLFFLKKKSKK